MEFKKWFVVERAKALAAVMLTRRDDIVLEDAGEASGLTFNVSVDTGEEHDRRRFGVIVKAAMPRVSLEQANKQLRAAMATARSLGSFPYPVCVFYFTVKYGQGYFDWVFEPAITSRRQPRLKFRSVFDCARLSDESIEEIVAAVNKWYDAFYAMLTI